MFIPAVCTSPDCDWRGYAIINGVWKMEDHCCPECGSAVKRPRKGHAMGKMATLKFPIKGGSLI